MHRNSIYPSFSLCNNELNESLKLLSFSPSYDIARLWKRGNTNKVALDWILCGLIVYFYPIIPLEKKSFIFKADKHIFSLVSASAALRLLCWANAPQRCRSPEVNFSRSAPGIWATLTNEGEKNRWSLEVKCCSVREALEHFPAPFAWPSSTRSKGRRMKVPPLQTAKSFWCLLHSPLPVWLTPQEEK